MTPLWRIWKHLASNKIFCNHLCFSDENKFPWPKLIRKYIVYIYIICMCLRLCSLDKRIKYIYIYSTMPATNNCKFFSCRSVKYNISIPVTQNALNIKLIRINFQVKYLAITEWEKLLFAFQQIYVRLFNFLYYFPRVSRRTRSFSSVCEIDRLDFTDWISFLPTNLM